MELSPDNVSVAVFNNWRRKTGREKFSEHRFMTTISVAISKDGQRIVSGSRDGTVKIWDRRTGFQLLSLDEHDGDFLASCGEDGSIKIWNATRDDINSTPTN